MIVGPFADLLDDHYSVTHTLLSAHWSAGDQALKSVAFVEGGGCLYLYQHKQGSSHAIYFLEAEAQAFVEAFQSYQQRERRREKEGRIERLRQELEKEEGRSVEQIAHAVGEMVTAAYAQSGIDRDELEGKKMEGLTKQQCNELSELTLDIFTDAIRKSEGKKA